jgi:inner membrane protein
MDNVTHSLFALTLARTGLRRDGLEGRAATTTLLLASNAPDIDIVAALSGGAGSYLAAHRGPTHGPIGVIVLAVVCAAIAALVTARKSAGSAWSGFAHLVRLGLLGAIFHVLMDLPTPYGTRLLSPFSSAWFALDWMPIIDFYLLLVLGVALLAGRVWTRRRGTFAVTALAVMILNYGLHAAGHAAAIRQGGGTGPWRLESWNGRTPASCGAGPCSSLAAIPTFDGPWLWRTVKPVDGGYELTTVDTLRGSQSSPRFIANRSDEWVDRARQTRLGGIFYGFSRFPAAGLQQTGGGVIVNLVDIRYTDAPPGSDERSPFLARIELAANGTVRSERLGR